MYYGSLTNNILLVNLGKLNRDFWAQKYINTGAKFGYIYKHEPKNDPFRIIKMSHVLEASAAHPYQKIGGSSMCPT